MVEIIQELTLDQNTAEPRIIGQTPSRAEPESRELGDSQDVYPTWSTRI